jgi:septal ring factor EnvC (AmiA/AmiB activator)
MLRRPATRRLAVAAVLLTAVGALWSVVPVPAPGARGELELRDDIAGGRAREQTLASATARLARLERATAREVAVLQRRVGAAETELARAVAARERAEAALDRARRRVTRLRARLAEVRDKLATLLSERYRTERPDIVTVVLASDGFAQLVERMQFLRRVEERDTALLDLVRDARGEATRQRRSLDRLTARRREVADAVQRRRDALASIAAGLRARRAALAQAHAARAAALQRTRSGRRRAERVLSRLLAQRARQARQAGPGGPWAIPWPIVQCESGGQNLPPNWAGASGYYQFMPATWAGMGGSTKHAYQASKAEQDRLAAQLWAGGAGARNWVCAALVGAI